MTMKLEWLDRKGDRTFVGNADSVDQALDMIGDWCKDHNFQSFYVRWCEFSDHYWFDYGSHTCFFELAKGLDKAQIV